jgi:hypothetical protein
MARRILLTALGSIYLGCGGKILDLGHDLEPPGYASPDSGDRDDPSEVPTWVATHQYGGDALLLDETRVYWSTSGTTPRPDVDTCWTCGESFVLRSCAKNDCARTLVTYWRSPTYQVQIGVNSTGIYWTESKFGQEIAAILTCPIAGCAGRPAIVISDVASLSLVVDESFVYWLSTDSKLLKCAVNGCGHNPTVIAQADNARISGTALLAASSTDLYWIAQFSDASKSGAIMTAPKDGSLPPRPIADGLHQPLSLAVDAENVYFTECYSFGTVKRCPLTGCVGEPTVLASNQRYPALLGVAGNRAYWFTSSAGHASFWLNQPGAFAQLVECPLSGCGANPTVLVTNQAGPHGLGVDADHVYWTLFGEAESGPNGVYHDGAVMRMRRRQ